MANFLAVPLKQTSEVDLVKPLRTYISSTFKTADDTSTEIDESLNELNKLRNKAVIQPLDKHQASLDIITRYYDQLVAIENKLPLTPTQVPIAFKWKDAFDKGSIFFSKASLTLSYGSFERAAVLFNIGALMSQIAASQSLGTDEELKSAAKLFQQSAGCFAQLKDSVLSLVQQDPTPDLMPDTLHAISALMIAQGQEAIYLKASRDKMKSSVMVKIAAQCSDFYQEAIKQMNRDSLKGLWERDWMNSANGKQLVFQALAQYHQSCENNEKKQIGEELARLQEATRLIQQAQSYLPTQSFASEFAIIQKAHDLARKDNDFIYHERIPELRTLSALPRATLSKPIPPSTPMSPRFKDMFASLVPVVVHQALAAFEVRKSEVINMETARLREHTQLMNGILTSLNLPAALDDVCNHQTMPESIREKSSRVKSAGGIESLSEMIAELPNLYQRNKEILDETTRVLTEEKQSDEQLQAQFKEKWTRMASSKLTEPLWQEIGKYRGILSTATNADSVVRQKFDANKRGFELLSMAEPELRAAIPGIDANAGGKNTESVRKLTDLMAQVQAIKLEREKLEKDIRDVSFDMGSTFLRALAESELLNEEQLSNDKLNQIYGPLRQQVSASVARQESVLQQVQQANMQFCAEKSKNTTGADRETMLKLLASAHDTFVELRGNLQEGTKFYNDLTPLLVRLQQKVSDFCFARQTEKEDLMKHVQQSIVSQATQSSVPSIPGYHSGDTSNKQQPPPRPPPPNVAQQPIPPPRYTHGIQSSPELAQIPLTNAAIAPNPSAPAPFPQQQQQHYQQQPVYQYAPQAYGAAPPYQYQQQQPMMPQSSTMPYPIAYPTTYPGAGHPYQQQQYPFQGYQAPYGQQQYPPPAPPPPQQPQWQ